MTKLALFFMCFSVAVYAENAAITLPQHPAVVEDITPPAAEGPLPPNQLLPLFNEAKPSTEQLSQKRPADASVG